MSKIIFQREAGERLPKVGGVSPWGEIQHLERKSAGVTWVSTAGHGGFHLDQEHDAVVKSNFPGLETFAGGPWYEEDCDWSYVAMSFPELFRSWELVQAHRIIRHYHPERVCDISRNCRKALYLVVQASSDDGKSK